MGVEDVLDRLFLNFAWGSKSVILALWCFGNQSFHNT